MDKNINNEDILDFQGALPGASIILPQLCTASEERPCHIIDQIPACNKLLSVIESRLEENAPNKLSLISWRSSTEKSPTDAERREACGLIFWILKSHRCLDAVEVEIYETLHAPQQHQKLILECLHKVPALRRLKVQVKYGNSPSVVQALPCISLLCLLETLELDLISCPELAPLLCPLLKTSTALTNLTLTLYNASVACELEFWAALGTCKKLNTLYVYFYYNTDAPKREYWPFIDYLAKTSTLTNVHVALALVWSAPWLIPVLEALNGKKSLVNVILEYFIIDIEEEGMIEKFLRGNIGIRSFELKNCDWCSGGDYLPAYQTADFDTVTQRIIPWLSILKTNSALEKLRLKFHCFLPAECATFLEELSRNSHLKNVFIEDLQTYCFSLNSRRPHIRIGEKGGILCDRRSELLLTMCEPIRRIRVNLWTPEDMEWFVTLVRPHEFSRRVTDFMLPIPLLVQTMEAALAVAKFIEESNALSRLEMTMWTSKNNFAIHNTILRAVHRRSSIKDLVLFYLDCTDMDAKVLAYTIRNSKTICYLKLGLGLNAAKTFLSHLFPRILCNYTILRAFIEGIPYLVQSRYYNLLNVARRNRRLVARAAKFAAGSSSTPCAEAFEIVSSNPGLVDELCKLASVDETEATRMISKSLGSLQKLETFMQISGVVKLRVVCHVDSSGCLQLDDVDEYSSLSVRKYLRLADVAK